MNSFFFIALLNPARAGHGQHDALECAEEKLFNYLSTSYNNRFTSLIMKTLSLWISKGETRGA